MTAVSTRTPHPARPTPEQRRRRRLRRRAIRRRRAVAGLVLALALTGLGYLASGLTVPRERAARGPDPGRRLPLAAAPYPVRELDATYVDSSRVVSLPDGTRAPRRLITRVLYPLAPAGRRLPGAFPLVVFGHGYGAYPRVYWPLLTAWARAGYVVAAPVFPLANPGAPGGPNPADLSNQPADLSFVISQVLASSAAAASPLHRLIDAASVAVAGHAEGGDAALAVAAGSNRDHRVLAGIVLAGALLPGQLLDSSGPPVLAIQGTADTVNPPGDTDAFFAALATPKFLLRLPGAGHTAPFSRGGADLRVVEQATLAFLDRYVKGDANASARLSAAASLPGAAALTSHP